MESGIFSKKANEFYKEGIEDNGITYELLKYVIKLDQNDDAIKNKYLVMKYKRGELYKD